MILLTLALLAGASDPTTAAAPDDPNKIICRKLTRTGSRMAPKRYCRPASEWTSSERQARGEVEAMKSRNQAGNPLFGPN